MAVLAAFGAVIGGFFVDDKGHGGTGPYWSIGRVGFDEEGEIGVVF